MIKGFTGNLGGDLRGNLPSPHVIALSDKPGHRFPILELVEGKYLKIENGYIVCKDIEGGIGDHRFLSNKDAANQHPATSIYTDITNFNHNLSSADTTVQKALDTLDNLVIPSPPTVSTINPLPDGIASPGNTSSNKYSAEGHIHPKITAEVDGSFLIPTRLQDPVPLVKCILAPMVRWADAKCCFGSPVSCVTEIWDGWTEQPDGSMLRDAPGVLDSRYFDGVSPSVGDRVFAWTNGLHTTYDYIHLGIWIIDSLGDVTNAAMHRAPDADANADFSYGRPVHVQEGTSYGNHTFRYYGIPYLVLGEDPLAFYDSGTTSIYASGFFGFGSQWEQLPGEYTWHKLNELMDPGTAPAAPIYGIAYDGSYTIPINIGDKFLVWTDTDTYNESPYFGVYELYSTYTGGTSPVIRRVDYANSPLELTSLVLQIELNISSLVYHAGDYFKQTASITSVDTTATTWTNTYSPVINDYLLTNAQRTAATNLFPTVIEGSAHGGDYTTLLSTKATIPESGAGLLRIPAGQQKFQIAQIREPDLVDPDHQTWIEARIYKMTGTDFDSLSLLFTAPSGPITVETQDVAWTYNLAEDVALLVTDRLAIEYVIRTNREGIVNIAFQWNTPSTYWQTTALFASTSGTNDHTQLLNRNVINQHSDISILEQDLPGKSSISGLFDLEDGISDYLIVGTEDLIGIKTPGPLTRRKLCLTFASGRKVLPAQSMVSHPGFSPIYTYLRPSPSTDLTTLNPKVNSTLWFRWRLDLGSSGMWHFIGGNLS